MGDARFRKAGKKLKPGSTEDDAGVNRIEDFQCGTMPPSAENALSSNVSMNSYRDPHHSSSDDFDFIFVCTGEMQRRRRRTHEFDSTHNIRYVRGNRPGGRGAQGAAVDASTYDPGPRQQQREQSDSGVIGTLEKSTAKPVLKSDEVKGLEGREGQIEGQVAGRVSSVECLSQSQSQAVRQSQRSFFCFAKADLGIGAGGRQDVESLQLKNVRVE